MSASDSELLTPAESRLNDLEAIITTGKRSFIEVGNALSEILSNQLYKPKYKTFSKYVEARWGFSYQYANYMIQGCEAKNSLPEKTSTMVDNPRKARAAARVPVEKRNATVLAAQAKADAEGRKMRAQDITDAAHPAEKGASDVAIEKQASTHLPVKRATKGKKVVVELCLDGHGPQRPIKELERIIVLVGFEIAYRCDEDILRLVERWKSLGKFALDEMERRHKMEQRNKSEVDCD